METGVCVQDLASTMQSLSLFVLINNPAAKSDKSKKILFVDLNSSLIDAHMKRLGAIPLEKRLALKLDPMCLIWSPYVSYHLMAAASHAQEALKLVDAETQTVAPGGAEKSTSKAKQRAYDEEFSQVREVSDLSKFDLNKESLKVINALAFQHLGRKRGRKRKSATTDGQNGDEDDEDEDDVYDECSQDVTTSQANTNNNGCTDSMVALVSDSILNSTDCEATFVNEKSKS